MIGHRSHALFLQPVSQLLSAFSRGHIDDGRGHAVHRAVVDLPKALWQAEELLEVLFEAVSSPHHELQVGHVHCALDGDRLGEA